MGGHCEPEDATLADAALREAREESGIEGLTLLPGGPLRLDRHLTPCAWHLDVQYAALAPRGAREQVSEESLDLRWYGVRRGGGRGRRVGRAADGRAPAPWSVTSGV